jgi:phenylalanyl-tRNA synthetase beta chain
MKISLNLLRDFLDIHKSPSEIADILTSLGLESEGFETVKTSPADLDKVLTAKVLTCEKIPDTDHLSATTVDAGDGVVRSVVWRRAQRGCGPDGFSGRYPEPMFSRKMVLYSLLASARYGGVASQGMIRAQDELGLGHDHSGIIVLPEDTPAGISAADYYEMPSDVVFEIGLTPNRADATSQCWCSERHSRMDTRARRSEGGSS